MSSSLHVPNDLEEQDIGLYYHSRRSSPAISDSDISSSMSRPISQLQLDTPGETLIQPYTMQGSFKSPSLSQVTDVRQHRPILRSRTLSHLPSTVSTEDDSPSFTFSAEKVLKMREWALAFVVVQFDLDLGPVVRAVHPPMYLSPSEEENIAFSSFPDSLQFEQGSEVHSFRIRVYPEAFVEGVDETRRPQPLDGFMYGFSHFRQKRDPTSKRGYQQSSLVLLTHHQYPALYTSMISQLGSLFHAHGVPMLETACHNIASWQTPSPGSTVELGFLGSVLHVELPLTPDSQQLTETTTFEEQFNPAVHLLASSGPFNPPPIRLFEASLAHLWSLWECLVLCEPILVFGPSPAMTSQAIWWLRDLVRPIPLAADIRPYFTIHDKDHSLLINKAPPKAGLLIGVTNPFFEKSCAHWPHMLSVGRKSSARTGTNTAVTGPSPGWTTKTHRRHISKDRQLLKTLEKACAGHEEEQIRASLAMRGHFCARTNAMLVPLNRYLNTLMPSPSERNTGKARLKPFSSNDFLASLKKSPSALPFKSSSKQKEFYDKWLRSPAFGLWLARQEEVIGTLLRDRT
ncbi:hypothetical protein JVT61DRAFT_4595 [Boletus reticuloceps]|uniref:UDENN domain-containing protein n=1 Tax=Boletus reticuloceps TaxID=495285 RepID=A0A8I2YM96_9AGAM|nr:hypothetical protein JVT61DRAFT_4595 [Boletus reticuloceps]